MGIVTVAVRPGTPCTGSAAVRAADGADWDFCLAQAEARRNRRIRRGAGPLYSRARCLWGPAHKQLLSENAAAGIRTGERQLGICAPGGNTAGQLERRDQNTLSLLLCDHYSMQRSVLALRLVRGAEPCRVDSRLARLVPEMDGPHAAYLIQSRLESNPHRRWLGGNNATGMVNWRRRSGFCVSLCRPCNGSRW
jgi:hypothetical protein